MTLADRNRRHVRPFAIYRAIKRAEGAITAPQIARATHIPVDQVQRILRAKGWKLRPEEPAEARELTEEFA